MAGSELRWVSGRSSDSESLGAVAAARAILARCCVVNGVGTNIECGVDTLNTAGEPMTHVWVAEHGTGRSIVDHFYVQRGQRYAGEISTKAGLVVAAMLQDQYLLQVTAPQGDLSNEALRARVRHILIWDALVDLATLSLGRSYFAPPQMELVSDLAWF